MSINEGSYQNMSAQEELPVGLVRTPLVSRNSDSVSAENHEDREVKETYDGPENAMFRASPTVK
jgi:hypothetical protein